MYYLYKTFQITRWCLRKLKEFLSFKNPYKESWIYIKQFIDISKMKPATGELRDAQLKSLSFAKEIEQFLIENDITPILGYGALLGAVRHKGFIPWDDDIDFDLIREDYNKVIKLAKEKYIYIKRPNNRCWSWNRILGYEDNLFKKYPNQLIFIHSYKIIQVYRGTSLKDFKIIDLFPLDYFAEDYDYEEHKKYLKTMKKKLESINNYAKEVDFLQAEIISNSNIVKHSNKIMYGIDSEVAYTSAMQKGEWFSESDLYPLKKLPFENTEFLVPNNYIKFLEHRYGNWQELPNNLEFSRHYPIIKKYLDEKYKD